MSATAGLSAMQAVYSLCQTVAGAAAPPAAITTDATVYAFFGLAPTQQFNPQWFIAVTELTADKQEPRYVGSGRTEDFSISGVIWGAITDPSIARIEALATYVPVLLTALDTAIQADPTLGGVAVQSWLAGYTMAFDPEANGQAFQIDWEIHVEALVN